jgi:hypothetical protein
MPKEIVSQTVAEIFEASIGVEDGSGHASKTKEQTCIADEENSEYIHLVQDFIQRATRWQEVLNDPKYTLFEEGTDLGDRNSLYGHSKSSMFTHVRSANGIRFLPAWGHEGRTPDEDGWVSVSNRLSFRSARGERAVFRLTIESWQTFNPHIQPLLDPYDNSPIHNLVIKACIDDAFNGYSLDINKDGQGVAVNYYEPEGYSVTDNRGDRRDKDELLSPDHVKALFDLVDALIPQVNPQLPEQAETGQ